MNWWRRLRGAKERPLGQRGEDAAAAWLARAGYSILERNRRIGDDEADIIALAPDGRTTVVVEVKTRADARATPELAMSPTKRRRVARLAARLLRDRRHAGRPIRFDVVAVVWPEGCEPVIRHHPAAFESPW